MKSSTRRFARIRRVHEALKPQGDTTHARLTISGKRSPNFSVSENGSGVLQLPIDPPVADSDAGLALTTGLPVEMELANEGETQELSIREVYDAKFGQFVKILEEFDLEVQQDFEELRAQCANLSESTHQIIGSAAQVEEKNLVEISQLYGAIQNSATLQQEIISDMFMAIDTKIGELTSHFNNRTDELVKRIDSDRREVVDSMQEEMRAIEARTLARIKELSDSVDSGTSKNEHKEA